MPIFKVYTNYPVATDSPDHTDVILLDGEYVPGGGTRLDCSTNSLFNQRLYSLLNHNKLYIMDLGCAGGCFVEECLRDGQIAIGLEGSDYSIKKRRDAWGRIPDNLFTCDISKPFNVVEDRNGISSVAKFDVITAWEVLEHIHKDRLPQLMENIRTHLKKDGLFIGSVATTWENDVHQTVEQKEWWMNFFDQNNFYNDQSIVNHFQNQFIRGPEQRAPSSFIVALKEKYANN